MSNISLIKRAILQNHFVNTWYNPGRYRSTKQPQVTTPEHPKTYCGVLWTLFSTFSLTLTFTGQNHVGSTLILPSERECSYHSSNIYKTCQQCRCFFYIFITYLLLFMILSSHLVLRRSGESRPSSVIEDWVCKERKIVETWESPSSPPPSGIFAFPVLSQRYSSLWMQIATIKVFFFLSKILLVEVLQSTFMKTDDVAAPSHIRGTREHKNTMMATPGSMQ